MKRNINKYISFVTWKALSCSSFIWFLEFLSSSSALQVVTREYSCYCQYNICSLLQAELALVTLVGGHQTGHELVQGHIAVDNLEQGVINSSVTIVDCVPTWNISMLPLNFAIKMTNGSFSMPKFRTVEEATLPKCLDTMSRNLRG